MKSTVTIWDSLKKEFLYQRYSHVLWITLVSAVFLSLVNIYGLISKAINAYNNYLKSYTFYKEQGVDVEALLKLPGSAPGSSLVDNSVRYYYDQLSSTIYILDGVHLITPTLEWLLFAFCPIIFGLYGLYVATYDYKYKTLKLKMLHATPKHILTVKFIVSLICIIVVMVITLIISCLAGLVASIYLSKKVPVYSFPIVDTFSIGSLPLQLLYALFLCIIFTAIGFLLGIIFKTTLFPAILIFVYNFFVPLLGKYDFKNLIASVAHSIFSFKGKFELIVPVPIPVTQSLFILLLFCLLLIAGSFLLFKRQSKYTH
ncbi:ABC transporter permease subunit [Paenibacillus hunanensis]|uniref:ABC-type transport system involved in multi-copper enzyme maturation permease subunit n=1 Tax=Paenibacillus hunanensis TaxID=539262 RepID=A0ABU1IVQ4_9BACL|nr:ABC transporter permease subunit [Paenibacillus hunanensis]MDR6243095.1 ABC-type transport system involved in multi-copper enzyme maturation permease subunit [Paenibacillus hunanensis]GGJ11911.1 hypothetical protein GCM10008022_21300 [Paenibacillus hunanensis]